VKPYADACDRNRDPILDVLREWFAEPGVVLEIGAGTGQHAVYFAPRLPHLEWVASDRAENHAGIAAWIAEHPAPNLRGPMLLDVAQSAWPLEHADYVFSSNTAHIMSWAAVEKMFAGVERVLSEAGIFCLYGPFNRHGEFTSESNRAFDAALKARDPLMGIRDDQAMVALGRQHSLELIADHSMPANNRILVWKKRSASR
jgi:SAM-dependent methyltransferase